MRGRLLRRLLSRGSRETLNVCAFWSPSRRFAAFGGQWIGTPHMPASTEPTEDDVWEWALKADTIWARRWNAATRKSAKRESTMKATEAHYRKHGYNWVTVTFRGPDGVKTVVSQCVGLRTSRELVPVAVRHVVEKMPKGTCLARWQFETGLTEKEVEKRQDKARKTARAA